MGVFLIHTHAPIAAKWFPESVQIWWQREKTQQPTIWFIGNTSLSYGFI